MKKTLKKKKLTRRGRPLFLPCASLSAGKKAMSFSFGNIKQYSLSRKRTKDHNVPSCPFLFVLLYGAQLSTQIKVKTDNEAIRPAFNSGFCRMKRLQVFLQSTPLGCDASKSQGSSSITFAGTWTAKKLQTSARFNPRKEWPIV